MNPKASLCIIIPVYNEEKRLPMQAFHSFISTHLHLYWLFVNDGSTDNSEELLGELTGVFPERVQVLSHVENKGKAEAIRSGVLAAKKWKDFSQIGYWDADLSSPLMGILALQSFLSEHPQTGLVIGSRKRTTDNAISQPWLRYLLGRGFARIVTWLFHLPYFDTQCGAKIGKADLLYQVCEVPFLSKWLVDIELIMRLQNAFPKQKIVELPLPQWTHKGGSKLQIAHWWKILYEIRKVYIYSKQKK